MPTMDKFRDVSPVEVATIASVLSDPARAAILISLIDGCARTAGELAFVAGISAPTASSHPAKLVDSGMITVIPQGLHRYHRLVRSETEHEAAGGYSGPALPEAHSSSPNGVQPVERRASS